MVERHIGEGSLVIIKLSIVQSLTQTHAELAVCEYNGLTKCCYHNLKPCDFAPGQVCFNQADLPICTSILCFPSSLSLGLAESSPTIVYPDSLPKELDSSLEVLVCEGG